MLLQEVVDFPKLDLELFKGPQHPKGFHWTRLLGGGSCIFIFLHHFGK
jgi:hypothetical protein